MYIIIIIIRLKRLHICHNFLLDFLLPVSLAIILSLCTPILGSLLLPQTHGYFVSPILEQKPLAAIEMTAVLILIINILLLIIIKFLFILWIPAKKDKKKRRRQQQQHDTDNYNNHNKNVIRNQLHTVREIMNPPPFLFCFCFFVIASHIHKQNTCI